MANVQAAKRYAKALFELARDQGKLDIVRNDFAALQDLIAHAEAFRNLISGYVVSVENRTRLFRVALEGKVDELVLRFCYFLVRKGRQLLLEDAIEQYINLYNESKGIVPAQIVAARSLDPAQVKAITERVEARLKKRVEATVRIDPSLLGGFLVRIGDVVYDYSIGHQLDNLHRRMVTA